MTGGVFSAFTLIRKSRLALSGGSPSSVTSIVSLKSPAAAGVHEKTPVAGSISAPSGASSRREKVSVCAGRSESLALAVKVTGCPTKVTRSATGARTGGWFTSFTVISKVPTSLSAGRPLSVTRTPMV